MLDKLFNLVNQVSKSAKTPKEIDEIVTLAGSVITFTNNFRSLHKIVTTKVNHFLGNNVASCLPASFEDKLFEYGQIYSDLEHKCLVCA